MLLEMPPVLSKNMPITIHASLLVALIGLVWALAGVFIKFDNRLKRLEKKSTYRWSSQMEADVWEEYIRNPGEKPDLEKIRNRYRFFLLDE